MAKRKTAKKPIKKAPKKGGRKEKPEIPEDDWEPDYEAEGTTIEEEVEFRDLLDSIRDRLQGQAEKENWPEDRLEGELGLAKQSLQDILDGWAGELAEDLGIKVQSMTDITDAIKNL